MLLFIRKIEFISSNSTSCFIKAKNRNLRAGFAEKIMSETAVQYSGEVKACREIFVHKMKDYGSAWRVLRLSSLTDQIFIKAQRIRSIDQKGVQKVDEDIRSDFIGIVNYSVIALIQLALENDERHEIPVKEAGQLFDKSMNNARLLMEKKNHDYGEAWRDMRVSSFTDLILMKIMRIRQIEDNKGQTLISEGIDSNYYDMINYAIFALIKLRENQSPCL
jgi:ribosomal protein L24